MKLLLKQNLFSWFDSFDIFDENGNVRYVVKGNLGFGHQFDIYDATGVYDARGSYVGYISEQLFHLRHTFDFDFGTLSGRIVQRITWFNTVIDVYSNANYSLDGQWPGWEYTVYRDAKPCATLSKRLSNWTDTYEIEYDDPQDEMMSIVLLVTIDAIKCDNNR